MHNIDFTSVSRPTICFSQLNPSNQTNLQADTILATASMLRVLKLNYSSENKIASQKPKLTPPIISAEFSSSYCFEFTAAALMVSSLVYLNSGLFYSLSLDVYLSSPWVKKKGKYMLGKLGKILYFLVLCLLSRRVCL